MLELVRSLGDMAQPYGAWVRLHYVYPYPSVDEVVPLMATGSVLPYLDVPFQHSHPDVLKRMKRPASGEKNMERLLRWREACPEIVVRSTFIAGFPGETEAEFEHLLDFVREAQIDRAGCFAYSPVAGAAANEIADFPEPLLVAANEIEGALAGEGFHASDAGGDAAFEMELENSDLAGTVDMGAAA